MLDNLPVAELVHAMPGRARLRIIERRGDTVFFAAIATGLSALPGVHRVDVRPFTGSIVIAHGPSIARIGAAAEQAGLFALVETPEEPADWPELSIDPQFAVMVGLGLVALWQLSRGQMFPPAVTAAWYAAHLAGFSAFAGSHDDGE
jgi:hypothetical protein